MRTILSTLRRFNGSSNRRIAKFTLFFGAAISILGFSGCTGGVQNTSRTFNTVVIDAGHGGHDSGAMSRFSAPEKHAALEVARGVQARLAGAGFNTVMTRSSDRFIPLDTRARISNRQLNAIFVSVHFNYSPKRHVRGAEVYYKSSCSRGIASNVLRQLSSLTNSRGVRTANFRVLRKNRFPAVLVECGYLTNPSEGKRCSSSSYRSALAGAIARGVINQRHGSQ